MVSIVDANDTKNVRSGLTKNESLLLSSLSEKGKTIFGVKEIVTELKCSYKYAKVVANNLSKKGWVTILRRGIYLIIPLSARVKSHYTEHEFVIASHFASAYYIRYWSALNYHRFTEQTPFTVFIATTKRMKNRRVLDIRYNFVTLIRKKFFGFTPVAVSSSQVNISDHEKTLADALDHPEYCGGISEVAKCLWHSREKVSLKKIIRYSRRMGNSTIVKRLGYLTEILNMDVDTNTQTEMKNSISTGMSILDPTMPKKGTYTTKWNLLLNTSKKDLEEWRQSL